jgi:hypothetical protein
MRIRVLRASLGDLDGDFSVDALAASLEPAMRLRDPL